MYVLNKEKSIFVQLGDATCASIRKSRSCILNTIYNAVESLKDSPRYELFVICFELAQTPIPERKMGQKFYLRHKFLDRDEDVGYININVSTGSMFLSDRRDGEFLETQFTQEKIEEIKKEYNTDLKDFEIILVEEWKN